MMSDEMKTVTEVANEAEVEDFGKMFQESVSEQSVGEKQFEKGMTVEGTIVQIGSDTVYVNIGAKAEAVIPVSELMNPEDGKMTQIVGDTIKAKIIGFDGSCIKLSRSNKLAGSIALEEAYEAGLAVKARVKAVNKGGFELDVYGHRAFCPLSQIQKGKVDNAEEFVGQTLEFKISKYAKKGRDIVLSRTALMDDENRAKREEAIATLNVGDVKDAKVVSIQDYGAFVDVGGVEGLVHVSEISYKRITNPKEVLKVGDDVRVKILKIEKTDKGSKLSLSMKRLEEDPFEASVADIKVGATLAGKVVRVTTFGAFVEIAEGIEGLVHVSQMGLKRGMRVEDAVKAGDDIEVKVLSVDPVEHRIQLSGRVMNANNSENVWAKINEYYTVGQEVTGTVESVVDFGVFVKLEHRVTALLPKSEIGAATKDLENAKKGDSITAKIIVVDADRKRVTLCTKTDEEKAAVAAPRKAREDHEDKPREERRPRAPRKDKDGENYEEKASFNSFGSAFAGLKKK